MCGRFVLKSDNAQIAQMFDLAKVPLLVARFNIAPSQPIMAVRRSLNSVERREATELQWGLIPSWAKDKSIGIRLINARSETLAEKPSFREAFRHRRCLIPADGYYEWGISVRGKQPHFIHRRDNGCFAMAALWERWRSAEGDLLESTTLLTTAANAELSTLHSRMPVILEPSTYETWLKQNPESRSQLATLLKPAPEGIFVADAVSSAVNNPRYDDPNCIEPLGTANGE